MLKQNRMFLEYEKPWLLDLPNIVNDKINLPKKRSKKNDNKASKKNMNMFFFRRRSCMQL